MRNTYLSVDDALVESSVVVGNMFQYVPKLEVEKIPVSFMWFSVINVST